MRLRLATLLLLIASPRIGLATDDLAAGTGRAPYSRMKMKFEVTFMKIDVADIEALLSVSTASRVESLVAGQESNDAGIAAIARELLQADTLVIHLTHLRDAEFEKFRNGIERNLISALESGVIDNVEYTQMWSELEPELATIAERGVKKGESLIYRVEGERVRMVVRDVGGHNLIDVADSGSQWARAVKGAFFGHASRFRERLIVSLF